MVLMWCMQIVVLLALLASPVVAIPGLPSGQPAAPVVNVDAGRVTVLADAAVLEHVLHDIAAKASSHFTVTVQDRGRRITDHFVALPLREALARLLQKNYAIVEDKKSGGIVAVFVLSEGPSLEENTLQDDQPLTEEAGDAASIEDNAQDSAETPPQSSAPPPFPPLVETAETLPLIEVTGEPPNTDWGQIVKSSDGSL